MLVSLQARNFRNLAPLEWAPGPGTHLLLGGNGAGKTSLLEAVYVLATTRSFRTAQVADCRRHGGDGFVLAAEVDGTVRARLEVGWQAASGRLAPGALGAANTDGDQGERRRAVNGREVPLADHLAVLPVVAWTQADAEVVTGPPALRRRLLDRGVVGLRPGALAALARYRRALREKRDLLAAPSRLDPAQLASWNAVLAAAAAEVVTLRRAYAERLAGAFAEVLAEAALPFPPIALAYRPSPALGGAAAAAGEELAAAILARIEKAADGERRRGRPLLGPHRDDLEVTWDGHAVRATLSAGERKAASLLLAAAHGRLLAAAGSAPTYLLDDLDAELSEATLERVWGVFQGAAQLFAASNRPAVWSALGEGRRWVVEKGRVDDLTV